MARIGSPSDGHARSHSRDEWSCRVCTLLNNWRERRCGACDTERPADAESQPVEWSCEVCTLVNEWTADQCAACEHKRPASVILGVTGSAQNEAPLSTRHYGALTMTHDVGSRTDPATPPRVSRKRQRSPTKQDANSTANTDPQRPLSPRRSAPPYANRFGSDIADTAVLPNVAELHEPERLPEAPSFNLLNFVNGSSTPPEPVLADLNLVEDGDPSRPPSLREPRFNVFHRHTVDLTNSACDQNPLTKYEDNDTQLAKAGLCLSDSENEDNSEVHRRNNRIFRRRRSVETPSSPPSSIARSHATPTREQDEWECSVCTNLNPAHFSQCELCTTMRHVSNKDDAKMKDNGTGVLPCHESTHTSSTYASSSTLFEPDVYSARTSRGGTDATFTCVVCTNVNPGHLDQCELCETKRNTVACPVCTTLNDVNRKRCEVCETLLGDQSTVVSSEPPCSNYIYAHSSQDDIGDAPSDRNRAHSFDSDSRLDRESVGDFEDDFDCKYGENTTGTTSGPESRTRVQYRDEEENLSDDEIYFRRFANNQQPAKSRRPELREFEHFMTVDDAKLDHHCQIDYRSMFAESSRSRSYADRLQKRRRDSQKRKRSASNSGSEQKTTKERRGKASGKSKASKANGKKTKADGRRASTGKTATKRTKKAHGTTTKTRRSSAPAFAGRSSGINHYDTIGDDFGDDVTTMAWEGVGSAGYF